MAFRPGQSGNPKGRPKSAFTAATLRGKLAGDLDAILLALVDKAKTGDVAAARLLLDRVAPALRPMDSAVQIDLLPDASLADQGRAVMAAAASGQMTPGQAASLMTALSGLARLVEATELEARIEALEGRSASAAADPCPAH